MDHGSKWREQSTTDGSWWEMGFSCPACQPKTERDLVDDASSVGNTSLVIYTRGRSVARYAVGEAPDAACLPQRSGLCGVPLLDDQSARLSSGHAVPATPRFRVAVFKTHRDRQSISAHRGKFLLGIPSKDGAGPWKTTVIARSTGGLRR